jgi:hypothetical protein
MCAACFYMDRKITSFIACYVSNFLGTVNLHFAIINDCDVHYGVFVRLLT